MLRMKEQYLCNALDKFKEMIKSGDCSRTDILYFYDMTKYELNRRDSSIDKETQLTKKDACKVLSISRATFDRLVYKGILPKGKKVRYRKSLYWSIEDIEHLKQSMLLNVED